MTVKAGQTIRREWADGHYLLMGQVGLVLEGGILVCAAQNIAWHMKADGEMYSVDPKALYIDDEHVADLELDTAAEWTPGVALEATAARGDVVSPHDYQVTCQYWSKPEWSTEHGHAAQWRYCKTGGGPCVQSGQQPYAWAIVRTGGVVGEVEFRDVTGKHCAVAMCMGPASGEAGNVWIPIRFVLEQLGLQDALTRV